MYLVGTVSLTSKVSRTTEDYPFKKLSGRAAGPVRAGWLRRATRQMSGYVAQAITWKDRKVVGFLMNKFVTSAVDGATCTRRRKGSKAVEVPAHPGVLAYHEGFRAVDGADRSMAAWTVERASKRWCMRLWYYCLNIMILNMWCITTFWDSDIEGAGAYRGPSGRHGGKLTFMLKLSMQVLDAATAGGHADGGPAEWMAAAAKKSTPTGTTPAKAGGGARKPSPGRPPGSLEKVVRGSGEHKLFAVQSRNKFCEVCYALAPGGARDCGLSSSKFKQFYCVTAGVRLDKVCGKRMCLECYQKHWDHAAHTLSVGAKQHHRAGRPPAQGK